jgi:dTDP-glucose 4,6-dehydratase
MSDENEPVNIGNPEEISIKDFAKEVIALTGSKSKLVYKDLPVDDPKVRQPSIEKARKVLGWEPKFTRTEGLKSTIDYFRKSV